MTTYTYYIAAVLMGIVIYLTAWGALVLLGKIIDWLSEPYEGRD